MNRKNFLQAASGLILAFILVGILVFAMYLRPGSNQTGTSLQETLQGIGTTPIVTSPNEDVVSALKDRFARLNLPVQDVRLLTQSPLAIELIFQTQAGENKQFKENELWYLYLTEREVELAYRNIGWRIDSYHILIRDAKGEITDYETVYLYPDDLNQKNNPVPTPSVNDQDARSVLMSELGLPEGQILSLQVNLTLDVSPSNDFTLELSTQNSGQNYNSFDLRAILEKIKDVNTRYGLGIAPYRIVIRNSEGLRLLEYIHDFGGPKTAFWTIDNSSLWFPQPAETEMLILSDETQLPTLASTAESRTPVPPTATIVPTPIPTFNPYPNPTVNPQP